MTEEEVAVTLAEHGKEIGSLKHRMNEAEKIVECVHQLAQEMVGLAKEIKHMNENMERMNREAVETKKEVGDIKNKPVKRWDRVIDALIGAAAGAFAAQIF